MTFNNSDFRQNVHRSGWIPAVESILDIDTGKKFIIDVYVDASFGWRNFDAYTKSWIGFIHHPTTGPNNSLDLFQKEQFKASLPKCKALIVLSEDLKSKLQPLTSVPIFALTHPTESVRTHQKFSILKFRLNTGHKLVHLGSWLRDVSDFVDAKINIPKGIVNGPLNHFSDKGFGLGCLANDNFDDLLTCNPVGIHLTDASAVNTVLECIARDTPIFINKLPSIVEYLGPDYPLYVDTIDNLHITEYKLEKGRRYLQNMDKTKFEFETFRKDFIGILNQLNVKYTFRSIIAEIKRLKRLIIPGTGYKKPPCDPKGHYYY